MWTDLKWDIYVIFQQRHATLSKMFDENNTKTFRSVHFSDPHFEYKPTFLVTTKRSSWYTTQWQVFKFIFFWVVSVDESQDFVSFSMLLLRVPFSEPLMAVSKPRVPTCKKKRNRSVYSQKMTFTCALDISRRIQRNRQKTDGRAWDRFNYESHNLFKTTVTALAYTSFNISNTTNLQIRCPTNNTKVWLGFPVHIPRVTLDWKKK